MEIKANRIIGDDGAPVPYLPSRNIGKVIKPEFIVCHDTASPLTPGGDIAWLRGGPGQSPNSSAHVVVDRFGKITQLIDMNRVGWHAGQSKWEGRSGCNGFTVGIEIDNPGRLTKISDTIYKGITTIDTSKPAPFGPPKLEVAYAKTGAHGEGYWLAYTDEQIEAVTALCRALVSAYPTIRGIITHWLISPGRKIDTNPLFPLEALRDRVLGGGIKPAKVATVDVSKSGGGTNQIAKEPLKVVLDATVTVDDLNMRRAPSMSGEVMGRLKRGQRVDVQEAVGEWLRIQTPMGYSGYVYRKFVNLDD